MLATAEDFALAVVVEERWGKLETSAIAAHVRERVRPSNNLMQR